MIDYLNQWMSLIRFSVLSTMFLVNLTSVIRLIIFNIKSNRKKDEHCVHTVTNSLIVLANLVYLLTWLPYLGLSMYDKNYLNTNAIEQCILQYLLSSIMTTLLLSILVIRKIYCCFTCENAKIISFALMFAWILPQTAYLTIMEIFGADKLSPFEQSNKLIIPFKSYFFGSELIEFEFNQTSSSNLFETDDFNISSGTFLICVHKLSSQIVSQLSWHYVVLVIPLATIVFLSFIGQALNKNFYSLNDKYTNENCDCKDDLLISACLYLNLLWLLVLRPLIILHTLVLRHTKTIKQQTYLDFGTHFILVFCVCIFPLSKHGGYRTFKFNKKLTNTCDNRSNKLSLIRKHQSIDLQSSNQSSSDQSQEAILAMQQQYLLNRNNYLTNLNTNLSNNLSNLNNNLNNFHNNDHQMLANNSDETTSGYHAFANDNLYRYY